MLVTGFMTFLPVFWNNYTVGPKMFAASAGDNLFFGRGIIRTIAILNLILTKVQNNLVEKMLLEREKKRVTK